MDVVFDCDGIPRGKCLNCKCKSFRVEKGSIKCAYCTCAPALHEEFDVNAALHTGESPYLDPAL